MRKHAINCLIENRKDTEYIQNKENEFAVLYVKMLIEEGGFMKEEQLELLDELIKSVKDQESKKP